MFKSNRGLKVTKFIILLVIILGLLTGYIVYKVNKVNQAKEDKLYIHTVYKTETKDNKMVVTKDMVVDSVKEINQLTVLESSITKEVKFSEGDWFKKSQKIKFYMVADYYLDFSQITKDNVIIQDGTILIYSKEPEVNITFVENATEYSEVEKSLLAFGDIKYTPEELESIKANIKEQTYTEVDNNIEDLQKAEKNAENNINDILLKLTKSQYNIRFVWVK